MSLESTIGRGVVSVALAFTASCAAKVQVPESVPAITSTVTATTRPRLETPVPWLSAEKSHMTEIAPLTTPGVRDRAIFATSEAYMRNGWQYLVDRGFPLIAIDSVAHIKAKMPNNYISEGSGTLMHIDNYWVVLTAGHVLDRTNVRPAEIESISLIRDASLPNPGTIKLSSNKEFGVATTPIKDIDFGILIFPDNVNRENQSGVAMLNPMKVVRRDQFNFGKPSTNDSFYSICYPQLTAPNPTILFDARMAPYFQPSASKFALNYGLSLIGCSGAGDFVKDDKNNVWYFGPEIDVYRPGPLVADITLVAPINFLGEEGFNKLLQQAIDNYNSKH